MDKTGHKSSKSAAFGLQDWFINIGAITNFSHNRRKDKSAPVWPLKAISFILVVTIIVTLCLILFVDDPFRKREFSLALPGASYAGLLTQIADSKWALIITGTILILLSFLNGNRFKGALHAVWHRIFFTIWFIFYSTAMTGIFVNIFKAIFGRARPSFANAETIFDAQPFTIGYEFASFPSGHSTTMGALIVAFGLLMPHFKILFLVLGVLIALTRNILFVHFPSDVFAGLVLGALATWIYARSMANHRLLFKFTPSGSLTLREEGKGFLHHIPAMILESIGGKKVIAKRK